MGAVHPFRLYISQPAIRLYASIRKDQHAFRITEWKSCFPAVVAPLPCPVAQYWIACMHVFFIRSVDGLYSRN